MEKGIIVVNGIIGVSSEDSRVIRTSNMSLDALIALVEKLEIAMEWRLDKKRELEELRELKSSLLAPFESLSQEVKEKSLELSELESETKLLKAIKESMNITFDSTDDLQKYLRDLFNIVHCSMYETHDEEGGAPHLTSFVTTKNALVKFRDIFKEYSQHQDDISSLEYHINIISAVIDGIVEKENPLCYRVKTNPINVVNMALKSDYKDMDELNDRIVELVDIADHMICHAADQDVNVQPRLLHKCTNVIKEIESIYQVLDIIGNREPLVLQLIYISTVLHAIKRELEKRV